MRQRHIALRSAERRVQELHNQHRALLYNSDNEIINAVKRASQAEHDAHPYSGMYSQFPNYILFLLCACSLFKFIIDIYL